MGVDLGVSGVGQEPMRRISPQYFHWYNGLLLPIPLDPLVCLLSGSKPGGVVYSVYENPSVYIEWANKHGN